jgi:Protein of unknown function (DUF3551)
LLANRSGRVNFVLIFVDCATAAEPGTIGVVFADLAAYATAMDTMTRLTVAAAALAAAMCFGAPASRASGDAPWCAVIEVGTGEMYWDCEYRTLEACVPNVLAGNRGFCNLNPYGPGPETPKTAVHRKYEKRHT